MKKLFFLLSSLFIISSCVNEDIDDALLQKNLVKKDSEFFKLLERVVKNNNDPMEDIVCIDFVYSFKILLYNSDFQIIDEVVVNNDNELSTFLGSITNAQMISISYPIFTTLNDGSIFTVNNNEELKVAIDACSQEDIINYCNGVFCPPAQECVWFVPFLNEKDNKYASGVFKTNNDGTVNFNYNNENYTGTWTILFVNNILNLNISLSGNTAISQDWKFNTKFQYDGNYIKLDKSNTSYYLEKKCKSSTNYSVGHTGPNGGIIAHKKTTYSNGWQYIEVATQDVNPAQWGCVTQNIEFTNYSGLGNGFINSVKNMNYHLGLANYFINPTICSPLNDGTIASKNSLLYEQQNKIDWFLPSKDELTIIYNSLHLQGIGNFENVKYWSSSQDVIDKAHSIDFSTGTIESTNKTAILKVRPIRYF
jgi:hypothetical protein